MKRLWIVMVWVLCSLAPVWSAEPEKKAAVEEEEERSALAFDSAELAKPMQGDFDAMLERRTIRVLTT